MAFAHEIQAKVQTCPVFEVTNPVLYFHTEPYFEESFQEQNLTYYPETDYTLTDLNDVQNQQNVSSQGIFDLDFFACTFRHGSRKGGTSTKHDK